jgi:anti-sigma regulatory factor (Ser/Thr protein kinase)
MSELAEHHTLLVYDDDDEFVDRVASYLSSVDGEGEVGLAVLTQRMRARLEAALGEGSPVGFMDRDEVYRRPEATIAYYDEFVRRAERKGAQVVRVIGDLPVRKSPAQRDVWVGYEAILNAAFAHHPASMLCAYDLRTHPDSVIEGARRTHPRVLADAWEDNGLYEDPTQVVRAITPSPEMLADLAELPVEADPQAASKRLRRELDALRVPRARAENMLLAAAEVLENARIHGGGPRSQRLGRVAGHIVWELSDNGPGFEDPIAGYLPPSGDGGSASGLWTVRQLSDRLEFLRSPHGFTTRVWA